MIDTYGPTTRIIPFDHMTAKGAAKANGLRVDDTITLAPDVDGQTRVYIVRESYPTYIIGELIKGSTIGQ